MSSLALACRLGAGSTPTLPRRVRSILRKYPSMLHIAGPAVPILGPELVTNGGFDSDANWPATANVVISGGVANATGVAANSTIIQQDIIGVANKVLEVSALVTVQAGGAILHPGGVNGVAITASGFYKQTISAGSFDTFRAISTASGFTGSIDNVSVREVLGYQNTYSSFIAGNYRESTGQNLAAVDQQVGLVIDAGQQSGSELAATVSAWALSIDPSLALVGEEAVFTAAPTGQLITCPMSISEKTLAVEFEISEYVAGTLQVRTIGGTTYTSSVTHSGNGRKREVIKALTGNSTLGIRVASTFTGRVRLISVRELPGTHAAQATSGYQTYLRQIPKTLGPELLTADGSGGSVSGWSTVLGGALSSVAGRLRLAVPAGTADRAVSLAIPTVAGKDYAVSMSGYLGTLTGYWILRAASSDDGVTALAQTSARTDSGGVAQVVFKGTGGNVRVAFIAVGGSTGQYGEFDDVSVREVLDWAYAWQFDGVDDRLPLTSLPLSSGDDFYQAFALRCSVSSANKTFADLLTNPSTGTSLGCLRINGANALQVVHSNDAGGVVTTAGRTITDGQQLVVEALRVGASHTVFADGAVDIQTALAGNYTTTHATIGARGAGTSEQFLGFLYASFALKGAPSDGERATIRRFLAQLQGRSL